MNQILNYRYVFYGALMFSIFIYFFSIFRVQGVSMEPKFKDGQIVITEKYSLLTKSINRGDVIGFVNVREKYNENKKYLLKRVVALPGETVYYSRSVDSQEIYIANEIGELFSLDKDYKKVKTSFQVTNAFKKTVLGPEDYYLVGDNLLVSEDSRNFGTVQIHEMLGKVVLHI